MIRGHCVDDDGDWEHEPGGCEECPPGAPCCTAEPVKKPQPIEGWRMLSGDDDEAALNWILTASESDIANVLRHNMPLAARVMKLVLGR